jgi:pimeloyl-ACP methyl ester carboxylesterase
MEPRREGIRRRAARHAPNEYAIPQYCADMNALIARLCTEQVDWIGTSLGGLIGIVLAGLPGNLIRRLVVNDIGPFLPWAGLARIGAYVSAMPAEFRDLAGQSPSNSRRN